MSEARGEFLSFMGLGLGICWDFVDVGRWVCGSNHDTYKPKIVFPPENPTWKMVFFSFFFERRRNRPEKPVWPGGRSGRHGRSNQGDWKRWIWPLFRNRVTIAMPDVTGSPAKAALIELQGLIPFWTACSLLPLWPRQPAVQAGVLVRCLGGPRMGSRLRAVQGTCRMLQAGLLVRHGAGRSVHYTRR